MAPGVTEAELLGLAASLEKASEHPLAEAIVRYAEEAGVEVSQATEFAAEAGQGVSGMVSGRKVLAGNQKMMDAQKVILDGMDAKQENYQRKADSAVHCSGSEASWNDRSGRSGEEEPVRKRSARWSRWDLMWSC